VLWRPEFFGVKPQLAIKNGFVARAPVGSGNDSTRLGQPQVYRAMFGAQGLAPASLCVALVAQGRQTPAWASGCKCAAASRRCAVRGA
jgi:urease subunit alpha